MDQLKLVVEMISEEVAEFADEYWAQLGQESRRSIFSQWIGKAMDKFEGELGHVVARAVGDCLRDMGYEMLDNPAFYDR